MILIVGIDIIIYKPISPKISAEAGQSSSQSVTNVSGINDITFPGIIQLDLSINLEIDIQIRVTYRHAHKKAKHNDFYTVFLSQKRYFTDEKNRYNVNCSFHRIH